MVIAFVSLARTPNRKSPLGRTRDGWKYNIKMEQEMDTKNATKTGVICLKTGSSGGPFSML
jgi:hypothetical protein